MKPIFIFVLISFSFCSKAQTPLTDLSASITTPIFHETTKTNIGLLADNDLVVLSTMEIQRGVRHLETSTILTPNIRKSPLPTIGWIVTGGLAGYSLVLASAINKDVDTYNAKPYVLNPTELKQYDDLKSNIDRKKSQFIVVAGTAGLLAIANVVYLLVRKPPVKNTSINIESTPSVVGIRIVRRF